VQITTAQPAWRGWRYRITLRKIHEVDVPTTIIEEGCPTPIGEAGDHARVATELLIVLALFTFTIDIPAIDSRLCWWIGLLTLLFLLVRQSDKGHTSTIRTPGRITGAVRHGGQLLRLTTGEIDQVDLALLIVTCRHKRQPATIRAPAWLAVMLPTAETAR
jgi:hypothetical protein